MYDVIEVGNGGITVGKVISIKDLRIVLEDLVDAVQEEADITEKAYMRNDKSAMEYKQSTATLFGKLKVLNALTYFCNEMEEL